MAVTTAQAALVTDPNDARSWQGATVGTFALKVYGADTLANRQLVVNNQLLDDSVFDPTGYTSATLKSTAWSTAYNAGGCKGTSSDTTGTGSYAYTCASTANFTQLSSYANSVDNKWFQSSGTIGDTVFDLGFQATKAAVFNSIDHGPLPGEAIESTVYLSNDLVNWTQGVLERVWLEGHELNTGILWDGFVYAVGTGTTNTFRYASTIHGGPGALRVDGDDEINAIMGLEADFTPVTVPEPAALGLFGLGLLGLGAARRRFRVV
ncbi:MAG: PEP-CTERM sorting domain-containing protein [Alphaproteobacteria bacterium]|nr:PEP-CTERM sorting domain-containing protein [Alphaproteobacteria bacterium]MDP6564822.1 PEP-CTERM sorting domain-containing protein [Alphaproteobacteria bacterium]MDP6814488.1 PEP-CTERM sorting domain-containing protein [Alphaproteobacteria bacterium]